MSPTFTRLVAAALLCTAHTVLAAGAVEDAQKLIAQGQNDEALSKLNAQLKSQPQDAEARFLRGIVLVKLNKTAEAIKSFADLTRDYPQLPEPYNNLAVLYAQQGDYEKARDALEAALATHPSYSTAHENLGDIYAALAGASYNRALMLDQANAAIRTKLSLINQLDGGRPAAGPAVAAAPAPTPAPAAAAPAPQPAPAVASAPSADAASSQAAIAAVNAWAASWSAKDVDAYISAYSPDFVPEGGLGRATWEQQRRERISRPTRISVKPQNVEVGSLSGGKLQVSFLQAYESDAFSEKTNKVLELQQSGGRWLIAREYTR